MKTLILASALCGTWLGLALLALVEPSHGQDAQVQARITITSTLDGVRISRGTRSYKYLLWNRGITARPLGHAFTMCVVAPGGVRGCTSIYTLPLGRLIVTSEVHNLNRSFGVILGGSRSQRAVREGRPGYTGATGSAQQTRIGPGTYSLTFLLGA